jgi:multiple antibiotic resistance protein
VPTTFDNRFVYEFVTLFVILDPVATIPLFLLVTAGLSRRQSLAVAGYALVVAFLVLLFFIAGGQFLLEALKIPMAAFQLAGSIILLLFGINMVLGRMAKDVEAIPSDTALLERAIFPLAIPGIAGAGAMLTVVLLTDNNSRTFAEQASTTGVLALCLVCLFLLFALSGVIFRLVGRAGIEVISRVFGLILASIAVNGLIVAIKLSFLLK